MEDDMVEAPYFYLSGYSKTGKINYLNLPDISPARWELTENWEGAVLPINTLEDTPYKSFQKTLIDYLNKSLEWYLQMRIE